MGFFGVISSRIFFFTMVNRNFQGYYSEMTQVFAKLQQTFNYYFPHLKSVKIFLKGHFKISNLNFKICEILPKNNTKIQFPLNYGAAVTLI